ncbi:hypothetical protein [Paludisphaera rhizosphaerae]|uniref:hypothetical protein n=1 Tax=Paludisphaera rhizosphaerae TaxID=2711216 RepID=UPI0013EBE125|nr:hypothetical protein [Paludisphaera rhizosphaerae]
MLSCDDRRRAGLRLEVEPPTPSFVSRAVPSDGCTIAATINQASTASSQFRFTVAAKGLTGAADSVFMLGSILTVTPAIRLQAGWEVVLNLAPDAASALVGDGTCVGSSVTATKNTTDSPGGGKTAIPAPAGLSSVVMMIGRL